MEINDNFGRQLSGQVSILYLNLHAPKISEKITISETIKARIIKTVIYNSSFKFFILLSCSIAIYFGQPI